MPPSIPWVREKTSMSNFRSLVVKRLHLGKVIPPPRNALPDTYVGGAVSPRVKMWRTPNSLDVRYLYSFHFPCGELVLVLLAFM